MGKLEFCERVVSLERKLISFQDRPYLPAIYALEEQNLVLRCSRQTEKSTFLANTILYNACMQPGIRMLLVCPRFEQARVFCRGRLIPAIEQSPLIRRVLLGRKAHRPQITHMIYANGSQLYVRAAFHSGDACRGLSVDVLMVDEFQDIAAGDLPVLQETLSHAEHGHTILTGTPKSVDNHLDDVFRRSTANEWTISCRQCQRAVILDERVLGGGGLVCPGCQTAVDPRAGRWVPRNPNAAWGQGFWICHPMVPWLNYDDILERRRSYDIARFKNEVLGLPTVLGEHVATRDEVEACCGRMPMADQHADIPPAGQRALVAGIDWGGGGVSRTVLVLGFLRSDFVFQVCRMERFPATEDPQVVLAAVADRCQRFRVALIAADGGGNGHVYNRLLMDRLRRPGGMFAILYGAVDQEPRADGALVKWTVSRSASIGVVFSRIKKRLMLFPRLADCASFVDEFVAEVAEYDDINRTIKYTHPDTQPDDALHATNYALLLALRTFSPRTPSIEELS